MNAIDIPLMVQASLRRDITMLNIFKELAPVKCMMTFFGKVLQLDYK